MYIKKNILMTLNVHKEYSYDFDILMTLNVHKEEYSYDFECT